MIDITQPNMILMKDGVEVSRHRSAVEAMEKAAESGAGTYTLVRPDATIVVDGESVETPVSPDPVEPDPVDPDPQPDPVDPPSGEVDWQTFRTDAFGATYVGLTRLGNSRGSVHFEQAAYNRGGVSVTQDRMFVAGMDTGGRIAEYSYPDFQDVALSTSAPIASKKQEWGDWLKVGDENGWTGNRAMITNLNDDGEKLWVMTSPPYDSGAQESTDSISIVGYDGSIDQFYSANGNARSAGWMGKIPEEWQEAFGGTHFIGSNNNTSIVRRHSVGPSMYVFDGSPEAAATAVPKMVFPLDGPEGPQPMGSFDLESPVGNPMFNQESKARVMFFWGDDVYVFGETDGLFSEIKYASSGYYPADPDDKWGYFWKFRVQDILAAENPWDVRPYDYGRVKWPVGEQGEIEKFQTFYFDDDTESLYATKVVGYQGGPNYDKPPTVFKWDWSSVPKVRH